MKEERIFPIMNKLDKVWSNNLDKTFCEVYNELTGGKSLSDDEFSKSLTVYLDEHEISHNVAKAKRKAAAKKKEDDKGNQ